MLAPRRRAGFSMIEMVVAITILAVLGAAVLPATNNYLTMKKAKDTISVLDSLNVAVLRFRTAMGRYPGKLSLLTTIPTALNSNFPTSCANGATAANRQFTAANVTTWSSTGPFYAGFIPTGGLQVPLGIIDDVMDRVPLTLTGTNTPGMLQVVIPNVDYSDAMTVNQILDGIGDVNGANRINSTGQITWSTTPSASETVSLIYRIPVGKVC